MNISFLEMRIENFKNHHVLTVNFNDMTKIEGKNGAGKSSIGDAVTYVLYGTDALGTKLDPRPVGCDDKVETKVELLLKVDEQQILLGRIQKKTAKYYVNEVPEKATRFNEIVEGLFDKTLFLSLFNPTYFFTQHWQDQRKQLLSYVSEPLNKEVLAGLPSVSQSQLEPQLKKHSLDDLEKLHRDRFKNQDKALERASERVVTLKEQVSNNDYNINEHELKEKIDVLSKELLEYENRNINVHQQSRERSRLELRSESLKGEIQRQKDILTAIKTETLDEHCATCGQALDEKSIAKVKQQRQARYNTEADKGIKLVQELKDVNEKLNELPEPVEENPAEASRLVKIYSELNNLRDQLGDINRTKELLESIATAEENQHSIRKERNESLVLIDAIKSFRTKRSELMVHKIDSLFTTISVRLYEQLKNGEERATFEIERDGKPYSKLSTAEKIKAGLELIEVLSKQSEVVTPTFVDNAESILNFTKPSGQIIVARVVDKELEIIGVSLKEEAINE